MLTDKNFNEVFKLCKTEREIDLKCMKMVLSASGFEFLPQRYEVKEKSQLPKIAVLSLETPKCWHWSLFCDGIFYDPEYGVLSDFPPSYRRYYWEIIKV